MLDEAQGITGFSNVIPGVSFFDFVLIYFPAFLFFLSSGLTNNMIYLKMTLCHLRKCEVRNAKSQ